MQFSGFLVNGISTLYSLFKWINYILIFFIVSHLCQTVADREKVKKADPPYQKKHFKFFHRTNNKALSSFFIVFFYNNSDEPFSSLSWQILLNAQKTMT